MHRLSVPHLTPLLPGRLVARWDRFIAEVRLDSGEVVRAHCVNPGRMEGQIVVGTRAFVRHVVSKTRKLQYTLELLETAGLDGKPLLAGANTTAPHRVISVALRARAIAGLRRFVHVDEEVRVGDHRVDFVLRGKRDHFVEMKNAHLVYPDRRAYFPDSQTKRGASHVRLLSELVSNGFKASVLFVVQRGDALLSLRPSALHDPEFAAACRAAQKVGVRFQAVQLRPTVHGYTLLRALSVDLSEYNTSPLELYRAQNQATSGWKRMRKAKSDKPV